MLRDTETEKIISVQKMICETCGFKVYTAEQCIEVFDYFFKNYYRVLKEPHPELLRESYFKIIPDLPYFIHTEAEKEKFDIMPEQYPAIIDRYFGGSGFKPDCNYRIYHFMSGNIRKNQYDKIYRHGKPLNHIESTEPCIPMPEYVKEMISKIGVKANA